MTTTTFSNKDVSETIVSHLSILRAAIETYRSQHECFPGRDGSEEFVIQLTRLTSVDGQVGIGPNFELGPYITDNMLPGNPISGTRDVCVVPQMPTEPVGNHAWIYDWSTGEIRANVIGSTEDGTRYFVL